jgi:hypothetical protein
MPHIDKLIVTNVSALRQKYGSRYSEIATEVQNLIAADQARGLTTQCAILDDANQMAGLSAPPVTAPLDPAQNKAAIDAVYAALQPDYLVILGALDVVPHQDMINPAYSAGNDDDRLAYGDLPYACDAPYGTSIDIFVGPTRVVGRLPDISGCTDPKYFVNVLKTAASYQARASADYLTHLGVSASVWAASTDQSLQNIYGGTPDLRCSPPSGPNWTATEIGRLSQFFNCHGAPIDFHFYGQRGNNYPVALDATLLPGTISNGCIMSAECCYGAQLYAIGDANPQPGICNVYLCNGAYGFFGSTTIAYGPASGNAEADLICQYFLRYVLNGASLGRAALQAQQQFVQDFVNAGTTMSPVDLKTLAQFILLGDPALQPVLGAAPHAVPGGSAAAATKSIFTATQPSDGAARKQRREQLSGIGRSLKSRTSVAKTTTRHAPPDHLAEVLKILARQTGAEQVSVASFDADLPSLETKGDLFAARRSRRRTVHTAIGSLPNPPQRSFKRLVAVVMVEEEDGKLSAREPLFSR